MPVARIITSSPQEASSIAERLRMQGYTVEIVAPGEASGGRKADLELKLEHATATEVLGRIASRSAAEDADVYIGAGVFQSVPVARVEPPRRMAGAPTVADTMNGVAAGLQNKRDLLAKALREQRALLREARQAERLRKQSTVAAQTEEPQSDRLVSVQEAAQEVSSSELPLFAMRQSRSRRKALQDTAPVASGELHTVVDEPPSTPYDQTRAAPAPIEAVSGPALFEPASEGAVPRVLGVDGEMSGAEQRAETPAENAALRLGAAAARGAEPPFPVRSHSGSRWFRMKSRAGGRPSRRANEWRAAVLISCLFAALLMLAWAVVTRGPVSPLPRRFSGNPNMEQAVPFGGVTLKPPVAANSTKATTAPKPAVTGSRDAAVGIGGNADAMKKLSPSAPKERSSKAAEERTRRNSDDYVAEDEVIYHRSAQKPAPGQKEKASVKRISDF